jgi:osmotically-inducible protein OsmY
MKTETDMELRREVEKELEWDPSIDWRRIGVAVADGIVTLTGEVSSLTEKWYAERAVERVRGVRAIANDIEVRTDGERSDTDIARSAADALRWNSVVPAEEVTAKVEKGWITLRGEVAYEYQRRAAERAVRHLPGVRGVTNLITVKPRVMPSNIKAQIEETFQRQAAFDANSIAVEVSGGEVTLRGKVRSWAERYEAEKAAWRAPGVTAVHNHITVESGY